jgi:iron complex outermembrane receptor protein
VHVLPGFLDPVARVLLPHFLLELANRLGARWERPAYFVGAEVKAAAAQNRPGEFETPTPGYQLVHLDAGYRWTALGRVHTVSLRLDNLTDVEYREHLSRLQEPQPGRNVRLLYRVAF